MKNFRADAEKGGFDTAGLTDEQVLLSVAAWRAVGRVREWECVIDFEYEEGSLGEDEKPHFDHRAGQMPQWKYAMHRLIDVLAKADAKGQSQADAIESYLASIT